MRTPGDEKAAGGQSVETPVAAGSTVVVIGAGLAGLVCARRLAAAGVDVAVVERESHPGGRLATERLAGATFDHGAQFFTVRDERFAALVDGWRAAGLQVDEWCQGFARAPSVRADPAEADLRSDGHPRYVVGGGMRRLAEHLAKDLPVTLGAAVRAVAAAGKRWRVELDDGRRLDGDAVVCTAPVPETLTLLDAGGAALPAQQQRALSALAYDPCLALLVVLDRPPGLPGPGGAQFDDGPVAFLADNAAKGLSAVPALTLHAAGDWSDQHASDDDASVISALLEAAEDWLGGARARHAEVRRWRYSRPLNPHPQRTVAAGGLVLAGDAYGGPRVEGAALSGLCAAERLLSMPEPGASPR